jgi:hypothetical protein
MKSYVATAKQIDQAFESWIEAGSESEHQGRQFAHAIYQYFMATEQAQQIAHRHRVGVLSARQLD